MIDVETGSPAADAGIAAGDIIVKVAGSDVENLDDYHGIMEDMDGSGKAFLVMVQRGQYTHFVAIKP